MVPSESYCAGFFTESYCAGVSNKHCLLTFFIHNCSSDPDLMVYCCDFSDTAVDLVKVRRHFNTAYWVIFHEFLSSTIDPDKEIL